MVTFPTIVSPVRVIGGPAGPAVGPVGPTGPMSSAFMGVDGPVGPTGLRGLMGAPGQYGLNSTLTGSAGRLGPSGSGGYPGPRGATGSFEFIPEDRFQYYEFTTELTMDTPGGAAGCKFFYTPKRETCILFAMFTGLIKPLGTEIFKIGISSGTGPAPNTGELGGYGQTVQVVGPGLAVPFFTMTYADYHTWTGGFPYPARWFDLATYGGGGKVKNINCIVIEF